ncbi:MAG: DNA polymerase II large subunit [Candidatus Thermoplasmatota archaeon]
MDGELTSNVVASSTMQQYFSELQQEINRCYSIAQQARKQGKDPTFSVEIPQALDLAARVEQLVGPENIAPLIRTITKKINNRELVSLEIAKQIASGTIYTFHSTEKALDQAIRTGLAILTEGVLVAPLEGIAEVKLGTNKDGTKYVDLYFSGPIRSAGGTGQAMSVLLADVVRRQLGLAAYQPTTGEIERYKEEIPLYKRVQHLQYLPTADEIELVVKNCPICINGEGTEDEEVTGYRDLPRVETNRLRGGACLVIAEGLCLKAPKIYKHIKKLNLTGWEFLETFVNKGVEPDKKTSEIPPIPPSSKYIGEVIAGRPVLSHPSRKGGFRLRYGRARTAGLASTAINPAAMYILDGFITVGTQMKTERPGKGTIGTPCDSIEGPIVLLTNGDLVQINNISNVPKDIKKIIDLGEILIPFGEFIENNALLPDASYTYEWWIQELQKSLSIQPPQYTYHHILQADQACQKKIQGDLQKTINLEHPTAEEAFLISEQYRIPLHPKYNLFWHDISSEDIVQLATYIKQHGKLSKEENIHHLVIPHDEKIKNILIELGALHRQREGKLIFDTYTYSLLRCLGFDIQDNTIVETKRFSYLTESTDSISLVSKLSGVTIRPRAPTRIGTRMGRPEKAAARKMRPPPHVLFPLGNYGGNQRLFSTAAENAVIEVEVGKRKCTQCHATTYKISCSCGGHTEPIEGRIETHQINIGEELTIAKENIKERNLPETIKGVIGTISKYKTPEPLEKGILRAKHDVHVFKDGTIRFDMTDAPLTHFKPKEINTPVKRLRELGYTKDYLGNNLEHDEQICELKVQDVIISNTCADFFIQVSKFIDDLLAKFYGLDRFYKVKKPQDLTGHLVVGLAPHTSAGALGRIIGYTNAQVCYAHPFYHATKRRNADGDEDGLMLLMDALLNFSLSYIPDKRGGKMDLPLILTTRLDPSEVDKEAHNLDTLSRYPLAFYEATRRHEQAKNLESIMGLVSSRLGTELQYEHFGFTHDTTDIAAGPKESLYKTLKTMMDKMNVQLSLAAKIRAVDEADVAYKVIERHFLPDILGNLRAFSKQSVRCPTCNITYRRMPLQGSCLQCNGKLTLTVHEMSVKKYLEISREIADRYNLPMYARQRIILVEKSIDSLFQSDKIKNTKLTDFF